MTETISTTRSVLWYGIVVFVTLGTLAIAGLTISSYLHPIEIVSTIK